MAGIQSAEPLTIEEGSPIEPFNATKFADAVKGRTASYQAGGNLAWCNVFWSAVPGVPINKASAWILVFRSNILFKPMSSHIFKLFSHTPLPQYFRNYSSCRLG